MKSIYTIENFAKRLVMMLTVVLIAVNAWGTDATLTITRDVVTTANNYGTDSEWTVSTISGKCQIYGSTSTSLQFNGSKPNGTEGTGDGQVIKSRRCWNTTSMPGKIKSVTITTASGTNRNWRVFCGTSAATSSSIDSYGTEFGSSTQATTSGTTWSVPNNDDTDYRYFMAYENETSASYIASIVVTYEDGPATYTVTVAKNQDSWGTVSAASVGSVTSGTSISAVGATLSVGATNVTATPHAQDADYNYAFVNWTGIPGGGTVTSDVTVTANFSRTARTYKNYRTACCAEWAAPSLSGYSTSLTAGGAATTISVGSGTTYGAMTCESSNTGVLTVTDAGVITPVGAGTATVTVHWAGDATHCEEEVTTSTITVTGNVTVTFKKNGGGGTDNQIQSIPVSTSTALKTLAQLGYTAPSCKRFKGWATSEANANAGTLAYDTDGMNITVTEATTLWASWEDITYAVSDGTMTGVASHSYSANPVTCGTTLTITCAADGTHKGNPTVTATGTHGAITVVSATSVTIANVTSAITVNISYDAKENYTVTLNPGNGSLSATGSWSLSGDNLTQTVLEGSNVTAMPAATPGCSGWAFVGWKQGSAANNQASFTPDKTAGATFAPTANVTYYAVYRQSAAGGTTYNKITNIGDLTTGNYVIKTASYAMNNSGDIIWNAGSGYYRMNETSTSGSGESITNSNADLVWTIIKLGSNYAIKSGSKYVGIDSDGILVYDTDMHFFTVSYNGTNSQWEFTSVDDPSSQLVYNTYFRSLDTQNTAILLYKQGATGSGNYYSSPSCSDYTVTGVASPVAGGSVTLSATSAKEGEKVYALCTPDPAYNFTNWTISGTGVSPTSSSNQLVEITVGAGNVTATANFAEKVMYTVAWNVNNASYSTYTGAGTLSTSAESGTQWSALTLPDNPADNTLSACERTKFVGWSTSPLTGDGQSAPSDLFKSTSDANATSHTITGNTTFYAVFAKGGDIEAEFTGDGSSKTTSVSVDAGTATLTAANNSGTSKGISNATAGLYIQKVETNHYWLITIPVENFSASDKVTINMSGVKVNNSTYAATFQCQYSTDNSTYTNFGSTFTETTSAVEIEREVVVGTAVASGNIYIKINCTSGGGSAGGSHYLGTSVDVTITGGSDYVTSCACSWNINYITNGKKDGEGSADWSSDNCFQQVSTTHEWQLEDFTMPNVAGQFWVGPGSFKAPASGGHSVIADLSTIKYVLRSNKSRTAYSALTGMVGTLNIWDNSGDDNYYIGIYPDYQITYGVDGSGDPWTKVDFNYVSSTTYETDVVTAPTYFAVANFKYYVGVKTTGNTGYGGKSSTAMMNTMSGMTTNRDGKNGKWRMYEDSGSNNWYCAWIPYYVLSYDANGGTGAPSAETAVSSEESVLNRTKTVSATTPTRDGYTFLGWKTEPSGGTSYSAGSTITLTSDVTLYAQWAQNYSITYDRADGTDVCANGTCGAGLTYTVCGTEPTKSGYIFSGWLSNEATPQTYAAGQTFTMPAANVTLTAQWTANWRNLTFNVPTGGGSITGGPAGNHVLDNHTFTFPNITGKADSKWCWTFQGWTETAPIASGPNAGTWASAPTIATAGSTSEAITSDKTYYAVYTKTGAGSSGTVELTSSDISRLYTENASGTDNITYGTSHSVTAADGSVWTTTGQQTNGNKTIIQVTNADGVWVQLPTVGGDYNSVTISHNSNSSARTIVYRTTVAGSNVASATTAASASGPTTITISSGGATGGYIVNTSGYQYQISGISASYGPPTVYANTLDDCGCQVTMFDLTYNANTANFPGSTISCSNEDDYVFASHSGEYTFCSAPSLTGYKFLYWAENANGSGNHWNAGETVSCLPSADLIVYAIYEQVHTITFNDQGSLTPVTQSSYGATIDVPSATSPCSAEWAFAGWSETAIGPMSMSPTLEITAGTSTYTPTADKTLYAIYRKTSTSSAFVAGMSGAYKISNGGDVYAGACNSSKLPETNAAGAAVFYIKYTSADGGKYTIQQSDGKYLKYAGESTSLALDDETPYYWTMTKNGDLWHVLGVGSGRYLQHSSGTGFKAYNTSGPTDVAFIATDGQYYYRTMGCEADYDITFQTNGTTINWTDGYPEGSYKDIASGSTVSTFPTATFEDWTFLGWRTASYSESTGAPESSGIYSTGGNALTVASDVNLYPVFTKFAANEPFDEVNGGDYYIYYIESGSDDGYGNEKRVYAASYTGAGSASYNSTAICSEAREFTFSKLANGNWTIYDKTASKYLKSEGGNDIVHSATASGAEWTITKNGAVYDVEAVGNTDHQMLASGTSSSATFKNYAKASLGGGTYHRISIGGCTNRTFTSSPSNVATINIHGEARITSYASKAVKANTVLSVTASNIGTASLTVSSNNSHFTVSPTSIPVTDRMAGPVSIYVTYTPAADALTDGIEGAIITVSDGAGAPTTASTADGDVQGRHLPTDFVIAAKNTSNNKWYALPANMSGTGNPAPVEISVDDVNNPSVAYTETSNIYNLYSNGTPQYVQLGMKNNVDENSRSYALWANNSLGSNDIGKNTGLAQSDLGDNYQWLLTQTNGSISTPQEAKYTISNPNNANALKAWFAAGGGPKWGLYANGVAELRLIPASSIVFTEAEVVEWGQHGGVIEVDAQGINATSVVAHLGEANSSAVELSQTGTSVKGSATKYDYTVNFGNDINFADASSNGAMLTLEWKNGETVKAMSNIIVPKIVATSATMSSLIATDDPWNTADVHVLPGVTLTANAGDFSSKDVVVDRLEIYPGATVTVTKGAQDVGTLKVRTLVLRNGWTRIGEKAYDVARLYVSSDANLAKNAIENVWYADWYIDFDQYYPIAVPWNVTVENMSYLNSNNAASAGVKLRYYDGASRASNVQSGVGNGANWKEYGATGNLSIPATLTPGVGYAMTARRPTGKAFSIIRMPLTIPSAAWTTGGEQGSVTVDDVTTHKDQVSVTAHGDDNTPTYAKGWNLIANPYMSLYNGTLSYGENNTIEYANIPDINFQEYSQVPINSTTKLKPSSAFLVQAPITGTATFATGSRVAAAPSYRNAGTATTPTQKAYIVLADEQTEDMMGILVSEKYTADYELNADLEKLLSDGNTLRTYMRYNDMNMAYLAINEELAKQLIPVSVRIPAEGEYTFRIHEASIADELEGIYLTDYQTNTVTNLLYDSYTFNAVAGTDNVRFAINAVIGKREVPTGVDISDSDKDRPTKFIWNDKVYILHNNVIYDSTGKRVNVINK